MTEAPEQRSDTAAAFAAFSRVTTAIERAETIDDVLHAIAREIAGVVGVRRCSIHLRDEDGQLFRGCVGQADGKLIDREIRRTVSGMPADGVTRELLETRRPVIVPNARTDARMIKATVRRWNITSLMAVPMIFGGEVMGIINLDDIDRPHAFTARDAELASVLAHLAAISVTYGHTKLELSARVDAAQRQADALRRCAAVEERLSDLLLAGASLPDLVGAFSKLVGKPCAVHDAKNRRLAAATPCEDALLPRLLDPPCADAPEVRAALDAADPGRALVVGPLPAAGVLHRYLVAPIMVDGERAGRLVIMERSRRFTGADMLVARRAATLMALHISAERRASEADWEAGASLAVELLGGYPDGAVVQRRADRLGLRLDAPRVVAYIAPRTPSAGARDFRAALTAFREIAPGLSVQATAVTGGVAALIGVETEHDDGALLATARDVVLRVCRRLPAGADVVAGVSTARSDPAGYADAYAEAREVAECVRRFAPGPGPEVYSAMDLGAARVLLATSDRDVVRRFAEATFGSLVRDPSKSDLLATLQSFFDNMASIRRCAACLGVHENTIRYRLARVEELTGLPVTHDPDAQLRARLSMLVLMLQGRLPATTAGVPQRSGAAGRGREVAVAAGS